MSQRHLTGLFLCSFFAQKEKEKTFRKLELMLQDDKKKINQKKNPNHVIQHCAFRHVMRAHTHTTPRSLIYTHIKKQL